MSLLLRIPAVGRFAVRRLARVRTRAADRPRPFSWAHARAEWASGTVREGWLRAGDGHDFTAAVAVDVTQRLLRGDGRPGAHTPGALFGPALAEAAGGDFLVGEFLAEEHRGSPALDRHAPHGHVPNGNVPHEGAERDVAMLTPQ